MFCPRCGAKTEPDAAFCEACGERLAPDAPPPPLPPPVTLPTPSSGPPRGALVAGGVLLLAAVVVGVLALTGGFDGPEKARRVTLPTAATIPAPSAAPPAETTVPTVPDSETEPEPDAEPEPPRSVAATVARTCGRDGVGGDCHLSVRASPSSDAAEVRRLDEGDAVRLSCQRRGDPVTSSALGATSTIWSRTTQGGYVSNVYIKGTGLKSQAITLRRC